VKRKYLASYANMHNGYSLSPTTLRESADNADTDGDHLAFMAAAELIEMQTRALLAVEWRGKDLDSHPQCPECLMELGQPHSDCALDAALTAAGLPDQTSRDAERQRLKATT